MYQEIKCATIERARKASAALRARNCLTWDGLDREVVFAIEALTVVADFFYAMSKTNAAELNRLKAQLQQHKPATDLKG